MAWNAEVVPGAPAAMGKGRASFFRDADAESGKEPCWVLVRTGRAAVIID